MVDQLRIGFSYLNGRRPSFNMPNVTYNQARYYASKILTGLHWNKPGGFRKENSVFSIEEKKLVK